MWMLEVSSHEATTKNTIIFFTLCVKCILCIMFCKYTLYIKLFKIYISHTRFWHTLYIHTKLSMRKTISSFPCPPKRGPRMSSLNQAHARNIAPWSTCLALPRRHESWLAPKTQQNMGKLDHLTTINISLQLPIFGTRHPAVWLFLRTGRLLPIFVVDWICGDFFPTSSPNWQPRYPQPLLQQIIQLPTNCEW